MYKYKSIYNLNLDYFNSTHVIFNNILLSLYANVIYVVKQIIFMNITIKVLNREAKIMQNLQKKIKDLNVSNFFSKINHLFIKFVIIIEHK